MSSLYTWGIDGFGRAGIARKGDMVVILMMIDGSGQLGVWMLEEQDQANDEK